MELKSGAGSDLPSSAGSAQLQRKTATDLSGAAAGDALRMPGSGHNGTPGDALPTPRPGAGGHKLSLLAVLAVVLVGAAAFWLSREPATRADLRERAASVVDSLAQGTPLAGLGDIFRDAPPPPPESVLNPATAPGTLAGRQVQGTVPAPLDMGGVPGAGGTGGSAGLGASGAAGADETPGGAPGGEAQTASGPDALQAGDGSLPGYVPPVTEDSRVRPGYVAQLATWLVSRYRPGPRGGTLAVSVQSLNQRCGVSLAGMAEGGRAGLLRYAFHPAMIEGLYALYVNRFLADLDAAASARGLDAAQNRQFHLALAGRAVMLAGALEGVAAVPDVRGRLQEVERLAQNAVDINAQMATAVFELDSLREANAPRQELAAGQLRVDGLSARYRRALDEQAAAQRSLVAAIRKGGGQGLDEDSLLFVAAWVDRRLAAGGQALDSVRSAAGVLRDLARRCAQIGAAQPASAAGRPGSADAPDAAGARP